MSSNNFEIEEAICYSVKHIPSKSESQVKCKLDKNKLPKLISVKLLSGKVIPLDGVKKALAKIQKDYGRGEPNGIT